MPHSLEKHITLAVSRPRFCQKAQREHSPHASHYCVVMTSSKLTRNPRLWPPSDESESVLMSTSFHRTDKPWEAQLQRLTLKQCFESFRLLWRIWRKKINKSVFVCLSIIRVKQERKVNSLCAVKNFFKINNKKNSTKLIWSNILALFLEKLTVDMGKFHIWL